MRIKILILAMFIGYSSHAQQAWTQKKGEGYFQIGSSLLAYDALHIGNLKSRDIPRPITEFIISAYGEYGLSDDLTLTVVLPYHILSSDKLVSNWTGFSPEKGNLSALGNINLGLTYRLHQKNSFVLSSKLAVGINSSTLEQSTGLRTGLNASTISPSLLAGIGKSNYFASIELGTNLISNGYSNQLILNAQIGKHITENKKLLFILGIATITTLQNSTASNSLALDGNAQYTGLYVNEQAYYAINLKLGYKLTENWTLWSSMAGGAAKNVGQNVLYTLALGYHLK